MQLKTQQKTGFGIFTQCGFSYSKVLKCFFLSFCKHEKYSIKNSVILLGNIY